MSITSGESHRYGWHIVKRIRRRSCDSYTSHETGIRTSVWRRISPSLWDPRAPHVLTGPAENALQRSAEPAGLLRPTCRGATWWPAACRRSAPPSVRRPWSGPAPRSVSPGQPAHPERTLWHDMSINADQMRQLGDACTAHNV